MRSLLRAAAVSHYYVETNKFGCMALHEAMEGFIDVQQGLLEDELAAVKAAMEPLDTSKVAFHGAESHKFQQTIQRLKEDVMPRIQAALQNTSSGQVHEAIIGIHDYVVVDVISALEVYTDQLAAQISSPVPCQDEMKDTETLALNREQIVTINQEVDLNVQKLAAGEHALGQLVGMFRVLGNRN